MRRILIGAALAALVSLDVNAVPYSPRHSPPDCPQYIQSYEKESEPWYKSLESKTKAVLIAIIKDLNRNSFYADTDKFLFMNSVMQKMPWVPLDVMFFQWSDENPSPECISYDGRDW